MVLSMLGMSSDEHASKLHFWDDVAMALSIMASKVPHPSPHFNFQACIILGWPTIKWCKFITGYN